MRFQRVSEFRYLWCVLDEPGVDKAECHKNVASRSALK